MEEKHYRHSRAMLDTQEALLGSVVPSLRSVTVNIDVERKILYFAFFYDGEVTDEFAQLAHNVCNKVGANFPAYVVDRKIERLDFPKKIPLSGRYAYFRNE